jgi:pyrophosphatase PpaX
MANTSVPPFSLLFDLDGTLVDSIELIRQSFRHACQAVLPLPHPSEDAWLMGVGTPLRTQMRAIANDDAQTDCLIDAYREFQIHNHDILMREYAGVRQALASLNENRHPMAIVTSKAVEGARRALELTGLSAYMRAVIGCDSCERHKPDPEPVHRALEALDTEPSRAMFIGDSPHDIASGNAAGVISVGVLWGPFSRDALERAGAAHLVERPAELPLLVQRLQSS